VEQRIDRRVKCGADRDGRTHRHAVQPESMPAFRRSDVPGRRPRSQGVSIPREMITSAWTVACFRRNGDGLSRGGSAPRYFIASARMDFNAVKGPTRAARRAGRNEAHITAGMSRTATDTSVLQPTD
jgi:hypothetical protein